MKLTGGRRNFSDLPGFGVRPRYKRVLLAAGIAAATIAADAQAPKLTDLDRLVIAAGNEFPGRAGIWVKRLSSGESSGFRANETFNSASVIKMPVLVLAMQMADAGALELDERIEIRKADVRGGSGIFRYHDAGLRPTFRDVLLQMVITSDNTATDIAIARVGGVSRVNAWLAEKRFADMKLVQTTGDLFAKYAALTPADDRNAKTNGDRAYWLGEITPRAIGLVIEGMERKTIASAASCEEMMRMMRAQQAGQRRLNHYLQVPVAHKTGDFPPVLANDVGIIYARSGPIAVAFLGNAIQGSYGEAEDKIGRFAQRLVEYFDK